MPAPPSDLRADLEAAAEFLRAEDDLLVTSHINSDGDGIAGGLALVALRRQLGRPARLLLHDVPAEGFEFLDGWDDIEATANATRRSYRLGAVLDCPNLERVGDAAAWLAAGASVANIDHHPDNSRFGAVNLASSAVCSTCEMIYHLATHMELEIDRPLAEQLYTGILFDTGGFRYSLTTATSMEVGADLVRRGARLDYLADRLYNNTTFDSLKLVGCAIDSMEAHQEGRLVTMHLTPEQMQRGDPEATVNYGLMVRGVEVAVLFKEEEPGHHRVSLRSREAVDVSALARHFGGGGHARAAGCRMDGSYGEVRDVLVAAVAEVLP